MFGSLLVIDFRSREAALDWITNVPFSKTGVYAINAVHAFVTRWAQKAGFQSRPDVLLQTITRQRQSGGKHLYRDARNESQPA
ncbi:YciI family protein [Caballeronia sp. DA-9]|uniref:YciI family protein n=1 Tax=Caballeronia sp. DA-9 TaxID=3436237 RepID=UPI003F67EC32